MCIICRDLSDEWSLDHMEKYIKSLKKEEKMDKAKELKRILDIVSDIPEDIRSNETAQIRQAQYLLSRDL